MSPFWQFVNKVYDGENGGFALFIVFIILVAGVVTIVKALARRGKG